jgi:hypothetical protein
VHGAISELNELIEKVNSDEETFFIFLGDLVDRGPDSEGVVRRVMRLTKDGQGISICGNHDWKAWKKGYVQGPNKENIALSDETRNFLGTLKPYLKVRDMIAIHGGIYPALFNSYDDLPEASHDWMTSKKKSQDRLRRLMFVRRIDERGHKTANVRAPGTQWAELYDGRLGVAFYGHEPYRQPKVDKHAVGLDTACVYGGSLTAYVVEDDPQHGAFYFVKAKKQYVVNSFEIL